MAPLAVAHLIAALLLALALRGADGSFYENIDPPAGCRPAVPSALPIPLVAGTLGLFGCAGEDEPATLSRWRLPRALSLDAASQALYVSDAGNHAVRVVDLATGRVATAVGTLGAAGAGGDGGPAASALLRDPHGLALDNVSRQLYVADRGNHAVRCVDLASGAIRTVAGTLSSPGRSGDDGLATAARLRSPAGLTLDSAHQRLFVADSGNSAVRVLELQSGLLRGLASSPAVALLRPIGLALDTPGQVLYVTDSARHVVLSLQLAAATGNESEGASSHQNVSGQNASGPNGSAVAAMLVVQSSGVVLGTPGVAGGRGDFSTAFRGDAGPGEQAYLKSPTDLAIDPVAQRLYVADAANPAVRVVDLASGRVARAVVRPGYYGHGLSEDDAGDTGLALADSLVPGTTVDFHLTFPPEGGADWRGKYFYFDGSFAPGFEEGVYLARQFRRGVLHWVGHVYLWPEPFRAAYRPGVSCDTCSAAGVRTLSPDEGQWELGDVVLFPDLHPQPATQVLYMAEGHNFVVRAVDLAVPPEPLCQGTSVS